jgi:hypothetical protein
MSKNLLIIFVLLLSVLGCSSQNPTTPQNDIPYGSIDGSIDILGAWELSINPTDLTADLVEKRSLSIGESFVISISSYFTMSPCRDCFTISGIGYADGKINVNFRIRHPFAKGDTGQPATGKNRLDLDLFDLAVVVVPKAQTPANFSLMSLDVYNGFVANPDGFTTDLANLITNPAAMPYKLVVDDTLASPPSSTYNKFEQGSQNILEIRFPVTPPETLEFDLYLTSGYGASAVLANRLDPTYFNPEFNRKSAWKVEVTPPNGTNPPAQGNTWDSDDNTTTYNVNVNVYDWQIGATVNPALENPTDIISASNVAFVKVEIPGMNNTIPQVAGNTAVSGTGMPDSPLIFNVPVANENFLPAGQYLGLVAVVDERIPQPVTGGHDFLVHSPNGKQLVAYEIPSYTTYQTFTATVVPGSGGFNVSDVTPPYLNFAPRDIWIDGNYVYVASQFNGMHIFDISNPAVAPVWVGRYQTPYPIWGVAAANGYAYITGNTNGFNGMTILDVHTPSNPTFFKDVDFSGATATDIFVSGGYGFVSAATVGLLIVDIDPPASATVVKTVAPPTDGTGNDVCVSGNYAYLAHGFPGVSIIDISDIATASIVKTIDTFSASGIRYKDGYVYVADSIGGLSVIDVEPVADASVVSSLYFTNGMTDGLAISGNYLYMPAYGQGVKVVDISTPETASLVQTVNTPAYCHDVAISGNRAFVTDSQAGLFAIDITTPTSASISSQVDTIGWGCGMSIDGDYAYVANYAAGLSILNISNPSQAKIIKTLDVAGQGWYPAYDVAVSNGYAYLAVGNDGLYVIDIVPPEDANVVTKLPTTTDMQSVNVVGNYAYLGNGDWITIVDISTPASPTVVKQVDVSGNVYDVAVLNGYAYTANLGSGGFSVTDVDPPADAFIVKTIACANSRRAAAIDGYAFITGFPGIKIFDVNPPEDSSLVTVYSITADDDFYGITIVDNYLYTGLQKDDSSRSFMILDITDPAAPSVTVDFPVTGRANDLEVVDQYAFLSLEQGFSILKLW